MIKTAVSNKECKATVEQLVSIMLSCLHAYDPSSDASTRLGEIFDGKTAVHWEDFVCYSILARFRPCHKLTNWPPLEEWIEMSCQELAEWLLSSNLATPKVGPKMLSPLRDVSQ